jgi:hypothetical protein
MMPEASINLPGPALAAVDFRPGGAETHDRPYPA